MQRPRVPGDAVVRIVANQLPTQYAVLLADGPMPVPPTPLGNLPDGPTEPARCRLPPHHPETTPRSRPEVREPQQVKRSWLGSRFLRVQPLAGPYKWYQPRFLRMQRQPVSSEPLRQHVQHSPGVLFMDKAHDEIVRITNEKRTPPQPRLDFPLEPFIQHVVQIDVGQERRNHPALRCARVGCRDRPRFEYARVQPLADQTS